MSLPRILLSSPFTPYQKSDPIDDDTDFFYQKNTIGQKMFTMKQVHHWHPLHYIAQNINADCLVLENPNWEAFVVELSKNTYDVLAISFTLKSCDKTIRMLEYVRANYPQMLTVLGGYGTTMLKQSNLKGETLQKLTTHVCYGDGVEYMQKLLIEYFDVEPPEGIRQRFIPSYLAFRHTHLPIHQNISFLYSLGCNNRCSFCATSHQYGCKKIRVLQPEQLTQMFLSEVERNPALESGIIYDEDFLENRKEFLRFLDGVEHSDLFDQRCFSFFIFASVRSIEQYSVEELVRARIGTIFIGVESLVDQILQVEKLPKRGKRSVRDLFNELHGAGIHTIASTIVGWDQHTRENIGPEMQAYVQLNPTLTQIIPLSAFPGTTLWSQMVEAGRVNPDYDFDHQVFGYSSLQYKHLTQEDVKQIVTDTGRAIIEDGGPWVYKFPVNYWRGYKTYSNHESEVLRKRSLLYRKRFIQLFPLALASIFFFYGKGFQKRWFEQIPVIVKDFPIRTLWAFPVGVLQSLAVGALYLVQSLRFHFRKQGEQPPFIRYHYSDLVLQKKELISFD